MLAPEGKRDWGRKARLLHTKVIQWRMRAKPHVRRIEYTLRVLLCMFLPQLSLKLLRLSSSYSPVTRNHAAQGGD